MRADFRLNLLQLRIDTAAILFCEDSLAFLAEIVGAGMGLRETMEPAVPRLAPTAVKVAEHELLFAAATAIFLNGCFNGCLQESFIKIQRGRIQGWLTLENNR